MISKWNRMKVEGVYKQLCLNLIAAFKYKFDYELNSNTYRVAALVNVSKLHIWASRADCELIRVSAVDNLLYVAKLFLMTKENTINLDNSDVSTDIESVDSTGGFYEEDNFEETVI